MKNTHGKDMKDNMIVFILKFFNWKSIERRRKKTYKYYFGTTKEICWMEMRHISKELTSRM